MKTFFLAFVALDAASTFQGRFGSSMSSAPSFCDEVIYAILANDHPNEYPVGPEHRPIIDYSSSGGTCTFTAYGTFEQTLDNCDCSDPENYSFYDEAACEMNEAMKEMMGDLIASDPQWVPYTEKMMQLVCGTSANLLSVGLMILCSLLEM